MFDPWSSTFEEARQAQNALETDEILGPCGPIHQWAAAQDIERMREEIESGFRSSGFATLGAVRRCLTHGLVAPEWLVMSFNRRYDAVGNCIAGSWDSPLAFGEPYPGKSIASLRKARMFRLQVYLAVIDAREKRGVSINKLLFDEIGEQFGLGKTLTEKLYYEAVRVYGLPNPAKKRKFAGLRTRT